MHGSIHRIVEIQVGTVTLMATSQMIEQRSIVSRRLRIIRKQRHNKIGQLLIKGEMIVTL
jgi:hypothetical protein